MDDLIISFSNTPEDLESYYLDFFLQTPEGKRYIRNFWILRSIVTLVLSILAGLLVGYGAKSWLAGVGIGVLIVFMLIGIESFSSWRTGLLPPAVQLRKLLARMQQGWSQRDRQIFFASRSCRVTAEGVKVSSDFSEHFWKWKSIARVGRLPEHLCLQINSNLFYVIPRRAFESEQAFQEFCERVETLHRQALEKSELPLPAQPVSLKLSALRPPRKIWLLLLMLLSLLACCLIPIGMDSIFSQQVQKLPETEQIPLTLDRYLQSMRAQNVQQASAYLSSSFSGSLDLRQELDGLNFSRYAGYQSLGELNFDYRSYTPRYGTAEVSVPVIYQSGAKGLLEAWLETENGEWKIRSIAVHVPPEEVWHFLQEQGKCLPAPSAP